MNNSSQKKWFWLCVIALCVLAGIGFLFLRRAPAQVSSAGQTISSSSHDQVIKNDADGYTAHVPQGWYVDQDATDTLAVYPDYLPNTSSSPVCKIEMTTFEYASSTSIADWISQRLGADPTVKVAERSSETISLGSDDGENDAGDVTAIKWNGTMDGIATTIVYAFHDDHAYEIVPSVIGETASGAGDCDDDLDLFLGKLIL